MNLAQILESDMTKFETVFTTGSHPQVIHPQIDAKFLRGQSVTGIVNLLFDHKLGVLFIIISWLSLKISFSSLILLQKTIINYILGEEGYSDPTAKMCQYSFKVCWRSACIHYGVYGHDSSINLLCHWKHVKGMTYPDSSMISHTEMTPL